MTAATAATTTIIDSKIGAIIVKKIAINPIPSIKVKTPKITKPSSQSCKTDILLRQINHNATIKAIASVANQNIPVLPDENTSSNGHTNQLLVGTSLLR